MMNYKGYRAKVNVDEDQGILHGEVLGLVDVITFEAETVPELTKAFHDSVDDYLAFCKERNEEPEKPCSGRILVRLDPELHRSCVVSSKLEDVSLNTWIINVLQRAIANVPKRGSQPWTYWRPIVDPGERRHGVSGQRVFFAMPEGAYAGLYNWHQPASEIPAQYGPRFHETFQSSPEDESQSELTEWLRNSVLLAAFRGRQEQRKELEDTLSSVLSLLRNPEVFESASE